MSEDRKTILINVINWNRKHVTFILMSLNYAYLTGRICYFDK